MMKIRCVVERITYQIPEKWLYNLKCRVKDYADLVPVVEAFWMECRIGASCGRELEGRPKYGRRL